MYYISVEACLVGPEAGMRAARQMVVNFGFKRPARRYTGPQFNGAYATIDLALEKVVTENGCGAEGFILMQGVGNIQRSTVDSRDLIGKSLLRPIADLAQNILPLCPGLL